MSKKHIFTIFVGIIVSFLGIYFAASKINWGQLGTILKNVRWGWCLLAMSLYLSGHFLRGIRCSWIIRPHCKLPYSRATKVVLIGYATNNILPFRLGELVRSYVFAKREKISKGVSFSSLVIERILDGLVIVGILFFCSFFFASSSLVQNTRFFSGALFLGATFVMLLIKFGEKEYHQLLRWVCKILPSSIGNVIQKMGNRLVEGMACLRGDRYLFGILGMSVLIWLLESFVFLCLLPALGLKPNLLVAFLAMSLTNLGVLIPSTPGHTGTFHFFCSKALLISGATTNNSLALGFAIVVHAMQFIPVTLLGLWALSTYGFRLEWKLLQDMQNDPISLEESVNEDEPPISLSKNN